jgi:DNA repair exonuclease SbcCD ATPase subunit
VLSGIVLLTVAAIELPAKGIPRGRPSAAAAAARKKAADSRKKQTIQEIQNQVAIARQALAAAESQFAMSEKELNLMRERLAAIRSEMTAAGSEERRAREELREIESSIVGDQGPDSPLGNAQADIDEAELLLHREMHRVVPLPEHTTKAMLADRAADARLLSDDERKALRNDDQYQLAQAKLTAARRAFTQTRQDLLKRNPEWVAASKAVADAHKRESMLKQKGNASARGSLPARRDLCTAEDVAAAARATILQGEAMLRHLGVKNVGETGSQALGKGSPIKK